MLWFVSFDYDQINMHQAPCLENEETKEEQLYYCYFIWSSTFLFFCFRFFNFLSSIVNPEFVLIFCYLFTCLHLLCLHGVEEQKINKFKSPFKQLFDLIKDYVISR